MILAALLSKEALVLRAKVAINNYLDLPQSGVILEQEVNGRYILYMTNMYCPLFFMTF